MFVFDGLSGSSRTVRLRARQPNCAVCGDHPSITALIDYQVFCGSAENCIGSVQLSEEDRLSCQDYHSILEAGKTHLLLDVRQKAEFEICRLGNAIRILPSPYESGSVVTHCYSPEVIQDIPLKELRSDPEASVLKIWSMADKLCKEPGTIMRWQ